METKICIKCGIEKNIKEYNVKKSTKSGFNSLCRDCVKKYKTEYHIRNKDRDNAFRKKRRQNLKESGLLKKRVYTEKSIQIKKINNHNHYIKNKESYRKKRRIYIRSRILKDPLYKLRRNISALIYHSVNNKGFSKDTKAAEYLGCTFQQLIEYLGSKPSPTCHLDHICPNAQAKTEEETFKLQHYTNFRWLEGSENLSKLDNWTPEGEELCKQLLGREWYNKE